MMLSPLVLRAQAGVITGEASVASVGEALAGAQVFVQEFDAGGLSQASGRFAVRNVPPGRCA